MKPDIFGDPVLWWLGPLPLTRTMVTTLALSLLLIALLTTLAQIGVRRPETSVAALARLSFGALQRQVREAAGSEWPTLEAFAGTLFLFIAGAAIVGQLPGVAAPTANLAATSALAVLVFLAVPLAGIRSKGVRAYLKDYLQPNPLLLPLHLLSEFSRTLALALRLFGNMMSGRLIVGLFVALVGLFAPIPLMALDLLIGLLQAYIFTILACVYVGAAMRSTQASQASQAPEAPA